MHVCAFQILTLKAYKRVFMSLLHSVEKKKQTNRMIFATGRQLEAERRVSGAQYRLRMRLLFDDENLAFQVPNLCI